MCWGNLNKKVGTNVGSGIISDQMESYCRKPRLFFEKLGPSSLPNRYLFGESIKLPKLDDFCCWLPVWGNDSSGNTDFPWRKRLRICSDLFMMNFFLGKNVSRSPIAEFLICNWLMVALFGEDIWPIWDACLKLQGKWVPSGKKRKKTPWSFSLKKRQLMETTSSTYEISWMIAMG